jgi:hypothetical protein
MSNIWEKREMAAEFWWGKTEGEIPLGALMRKLEEYIGI